MRRKKIPCQSVLNKLENFILPDHLNDIHKLERVLVSKRLLFKKIAIMPKGQSPKLKGNICNVPVEVNDIVTTLPREPSKNGLLIVKLKRKLEYRGYVYFEGVRSTMIHVHL